MDHLRVRNLEAVLIVMMFIFIGFMCGGWTFKGKPTRDYPAKVTKCYDGDTCTVEINVGFGVWLYGQKVRLHGIDAYEVRGPEKLKGLPGKRWMQENVVGKAIRLEAILDRKGREKKGKYGRWLAILYLGSMNINDALVGNGYAVRRDYD